MTGAQSAGQTAGSIRSKEYKGLEIMDRVGGGDSFASGLIYGLMTTEDAETAVNYGRCARRAGHDNTGRYYNGK